VLGPDSLRLIDINDSEHHPRVFIEDMRTGERDDIVGASASRPAWSPNGRFIACAAYHDQDQASELTVVDRRTRKRIINDAGISADEYRWSPDSRWIAVEGVEKGTNHVVLSVYDVARGRRHRVARTSAFGSFGLSWSPDSKYLAFTKPTTVDDDEVVLAADLWVVQIPIWLPCRTRATPTEIESRPEWISGTAVLVTSVPNTDPHSTGRQLVFELRR
jgi:Tol biopolymer transport system component